MASSMRMLWCCVLFLHVLLQATFTYASVAAVANPCADYNHIIQSTKGIEVRVTDKFDYLHRYQFFYAELFQCSRAVPMQFFEIGLGCYPIFEALEPRVWSRILPLATQHYMDYDKTCIARFPHVLKDVNGKIFIGDQSDEAFLQNVVIRNLSTYMDVIIDDGSHMAPHQVASFKVLFPRLIRPGGYYVIEDLFYNVVRAPEGMRHVSTLRYVSRIMEAFSGTGTLPPGAEECTEVVCQFGLCWFKKKGTYPEGTQSPWCGNGGGGGGSSSSSIEDSQLPSRLLMCETITNRTVYHVQGCRGSRGDSVREEERANRSSRVSAAVPPSTTALKRRMPLFALTRVEPYAIGSECSNPSLPPPPPANHAPLAVVDDSSRLFRHRLQALRELFDKRLPAGGYYFWRNSRRTSEAPSPFILALYSQYCEVVSRGETVAAAKGSSKLASRKGMAAKQYRVGYRLFHERLCSKFLRGVWRVGCDTVWCYLQKRPGFYPTVKSTVQWNLALPIGDKEFLESKLTEYLE